MITTEDYKITGGEYLRILIKVFFSWIYVAVFGALSLLFIMAIWDIRFLLVGLMVIFILIPFAVSYLYIWYCLKPESRDMILDKHLIITSEGIDIQFENSKKHFLWQDFSSCLVLKKYIILIKKEGEHSFIAIPYPIFKSDEAINTTITLINDKIPTQ